MNYIFTTTTVCIFFALNCNYAISQDQLATPHLSDLHPYLPAIISVYGETWVSSNQEAVTALEDCFSRRMRYVIEPLTGDNKYPLLSSFPLMNKNNPLITGINYGQFNPATFVPITYSLPFFSELTQVIRVDGTDYIIIIEPLTIQH
jgi:hypothetical protein